MKRYEVTLHNTQKATVVVEAGDPITEQQLTYLALRKLDESGGAEWENDGFVETRELPDPQEEEPLPSVDEALRMGWTV